MTKIKLDIPIYFGCLIIVFTKDVKSVDRKYKLGLDDNIYPAFVQSNRDKKGLSMYWMVFDTKHIDHGIISHEVTHCANWIFFDRKITHDYLNDEPYAYLVGWITEKIYKYASKNKVKIK